MRRVKLTNAVKMDSPHAITGDKGTELALSSAAAHFAVRNGLGEFIGEELETPGPTRAELEAREIEIVKREDGIEFPEQRTVIDPADLVSDEDRAEAEGPPKRPYGNAPKSAWVRYAVSVDPDLTEERADTWTKADLMSRYGSRLGEED